MEKQVFEITFNGHCLQANEGEILSSALWRNGIKKLNNSFKMNSPRGVYCGIGRCQSCVVEIDGRKIRACQTVIKGNVTVKGG